MKTSRFAFLGVAMWVSGAGALVGQQPGDRGGPGPGGFLRMFPVMSALDADGDGEISEKEIENAVTALKGLDKDENGKLSSDELLPGARGFGGGRGGPDGFGGGGFGGGGFGGGGGREGFGRGPNPDEMVARLMYKDKNGDGKLAKDELNERMQPLLTKADSDNDGFASKEELLRMAQREPAAFRDIVMGGGGRGGFGGGGALGGGFGRGGFGGGRPGEGGFGPPIADAFVDRALQFDTDQDGKLNRDELSRVAEQLGRSLNALLGGGFGVGRGGDRPDRPQSRDADKR